MSATHIVLTAVMSLSRDVVECLSAFSFLFMWTSSFQLGLNRGIARPVQHCKFFLHLLQPVHDQLALVTWRAILEEEGGAVDLHEGQQVVFQDTFVALTVHGLVLSWGGNRDHLALFCH
jgi:hypothetical protein